MRISEFWNELEKYAVEYNLLENSEFLNLVFYKFISESSISDFLDISLQTRDDGVLNVVLGNGHNTQGLDLHLKQTEEELLKQKKKNYDILNDSLQISWTSNNGYDDNKRYEDYKQVISQEEKETLISIYKGIINSNNLEDISNIENMNKIYDSEDLNFRKLSLLAIEYKELAENLKFTENEYTESFIRRYLNSLIDLSSVLNNSEFKNRDSFVKYVYDYIKKGTLDSDAYLHNGIDKPAYSLNVLKSNQHLIDKLDMGNSLLSLINNNLKNNNKENLINEIFNETILPKFKKHMEYKIKFLTIAKSLEQRIENKTVNDFMNIIKRKYPEFFVDGEMKSFKQNIYQTSELSKNGFRNITMLLNKKGLLDNYIFNNHYQTNTHSKLVGVYGITSKDIYVFNDNDDSNKIVLLSEVDATVKSVIGGEVYENENGIKIFKLDTYLMLNKNNEFAEMGFKHLFKYCQDNNYVLHLNEYDCEEAMDKVYPAFKAAQEQYPNVFFVEDTHSYKSTILHNTIFDSKTLAKNYNEIETKILTNNSSIERHEFSEKFKEFSQELNKKQNKIKI